MRRPRAVRVVLSLACAFAFATVVLGAMPAAEPATAFVTEGPLTSPAGALGLEAVAADRPGAAGDLRMPKHRSLLLIGMLAAGVGVAFGCVSQLASRRRTPSRRPVALGSALERAPPASLLALP